MTKENLEKNEIIAPEHLYGFMDVYSNIMDLQEQQMAGILPADWF